MINAMKKYFSPKSLGLFVSLISGYSLSGVAFGSEVPHAVNFYQIILTKFGLDLSDPLINEWQVLPGAVVVTFLVFLIGRSFASYCNAKIANKDLAPSGNFSVSSFFDLISNFVLNLAEESIGHDYKKYLSLVFPVFLFIFTSNILGLVPGFNPPTGFVSMNLAVGVVVFLVYNWSGFRENGIAYLKHFTGPVLALAPLFIIIETIGHMVRPYSLSLRLLGNLFGDHLVLAVFTDLTWILVPSFLLFFGLLVAFVQSFIFTLLTCIYIGLAVSHDH